MSVEPSLFEKSSGLAIESAASWLAELLTGRLATISAILAIALVGFAMLQGRLAFRTSARVLLGCAILFGAPTIAAAFISEWRGASSALDMDRGGTEIALPPRSKIPPADYDPYAGASLRRE